MYEKEKALEAIRLAYDIIDFTRHDEYDIDCTKEDYERFVKLKNELIPQKNEKKVMKSDGYPSLYIKNQTITDESNLVSILNKIDIKHKSLVVDCLFLMYVGYGWGKYAFSVISQGKFTKNQTDKIKEMVDTVQNHEDKKGQKNFSDDDCEEFDMVGWDGHGW